LLESHVNIVLWIVQILAALAFAGAAYSHSFGAERMKPQPGGQWISALPPGLMTFVVICEFLGAVGLILPALTGILPWLTPLAGALLALIMLLAIGFHLARRENPNMVLNLILALLAAAVAYGRFVIVPL
jgi:hypothetical protein